MTRCADGAWLCDHCGHLIAANPLEQRVDALAAELRAVRERFDALHDHSFANARRIDGLAARVDAVERTVTCEHFWEGPNGERCRHCGTVRAQPGTAGPAQSQAHSEGKLHSAAPAQPPAATLPEPCHHSISRYDEATDSLVCRDCGAFRCKVPIAEPATPPRVVLGDEVPAAEVDRAESCDHDWSWLMCSKCRCATPRAADASAGAGERDDAVIIAALNNLGVNEYVNDLGLRAATRLAELRRERDTHIRQGTEAMRERNAERARAEAAEAARDEAERVARMWQGRCWENDDAWSVKIAAAEAALREERERVAALMAAARRWRREPRAAYTDATMELERAIDALASPARREGESE